MERARPFWIIMRYYFTVFVSFNMNKNRRNRRADCGLRRRIFIIHPLFIGKNRMIKSFKGVKAITFSSESVTRHTIAYPRNPVSVYSSWLDSTGGRFGRSLFLDSERFFLLYFFFVTMTRPILWLAFCTYFIIYLFFQVALRWALVFHYNFHKPLEDRHAAKTYRYARVERKTSIAYTRTARPNGF